MTGTDQAIHVLFFVDGNADNAIMAAGLLEARADARFKVASATTAPSPVSPLAVHVMNEIGIDIAGREAGHIGDFADIQFDHVISLCEDADENCIFFPRDRDVTYWQLANPASVEGNDDHRLAAYRQARDALSVRVEAWLESI